ncbi:MAG: RsmB/NOP family class I SAM-dependent RNA methyltransferase [Methyloligellaceae bacterium]
MADSLGQDLERLDRLTKDFQVGLPARHAAVALLEAVLGKGQSLDAAFSEHVRHGTLAALSVRDRALARAIAATALRRKGQIEEIFQGLLERPIKGRTGALNAIVLTAMTQLLFMETPVHAVVNLAVHQCQRDRQARRFDGLVNAILRRVARSGAEIMSVQDAPRLNTPDWLWERWSAAYGADTARRIAEAHLSEAALDLTVKSDRNGWARRLDGIVLPTGSVRLKGKGRIEKLEGFDEGAWWVQDAAAALPARLLGNVAGKRVADLCAAPGGKTAQLAHAGARVTAVDISKKRLAHLAGNLKRLKLGATRVEADATAWKPSEPFNAILLDAPCSATGTIRRHPDIPHLKRASDMEKLAELQARLLGNAVSLVRPGGRLVYCTCSLEPEEGERQIERILAEEPGLCIDPIAPGEVPGCESSLTGDGHLRTLPFGLATGEPGLDGIDGFFVARLKIKASS